MQPAISYDPARPGRSEIDVARWRELGAQLAESIQATKPRGRRARRTPNRRKQVRAFVLDVASHPERENAAWVIENARAIYAAEKETRDLSFGIAQFPAAVEASGVETARVRLLAREMLDASRNRFHEEELAGFIEGFQERSTLEMSELWGLKPALQLECLDRVMAGQASEWPALLTSLRRVSETTWKDFFESVSVVDRILGRDPARAYWRMDFESRGRYRSELADLARRGSGTEQQVAETAILMCEKAALASDGSRAAMRRTHVGYYLVDRGRQRLEAEFNYRAPLGARLPRFILRYPAGFYLVGIELLTFLIVGLSVAGLGPLTPVFAPILLLLLPATQGALDFINNLVTGLVPPRVTPKLDFSKGIPDDCATMVAVPTLLINEAQVHDLVLDLEIRYLANRDPNLYFALLTDSPDSDRAVDDRDELVHLCLRLIENANRRYRSSDGRAPMFLFHRHRAFNKSENRWMGWERKRGKLLDLNQLLRGGFDAFPVKAGQLSILPSIQYVITLDSDTQLPRDAAARLVGAIAHPLNQAVVDPETKTVVEGYGILQPRVGISVQSASRSRLAALYSGQTGFDIYTRAVSDVYQDLFGEGIFTGKGIYEVDVMRETLEHRFPENALLSHDLIEGAYARVALVSDIELIDDYPSHFSAYSRRKHRWVRGDWQIVRWTASRVPDFHRRMIQNPISLISQWKILDNLRRSLLDPSLLLLFLGGWLFLPGRPWYWAVIAPGLLFVPVVSHLLFSVLRVPRSRRLLAIWVRETAAGVLKGIAVTLLSITFLLHQALLSLDAIVRSVLRVFVTRRKLLEWETAAEAEAAVRSKATVDVYLEWTPHLAAAIGGAVWLLRPEALPYAAPVVALWLASRGVSTWLNRPPRAKNRALDEDDARILRDSAEKICRYFRDWSSPATNWLIPDSVTEEGAAEPRLSPTNLGMLLNARIAAVHLGVMQLAEFAFETRQTLERVIALPKRRGHLYNWYDIATMQPLAPHFVSTVDSGNLAACLWTLKQAALAFAAEPPAKRGVTRELARELGEIAEISDGLVRAMDFRFLYQPRKKVLSVGFNVAADRPEPSCYDLLASEARIACFVAIAKGDVPQEAWFHLGRAHSVYRGERVLLSWTGTMFEYLMPALWMRHYASTILEHSMKAVVRVQREYARRKGAPWGISESACLDESGVGCGYAAFGIRELAMKRRRGDALVISPYSTFLALCADPGAAVANLRHMEAYGWMGRYGFYEAVDYAREGGEVIRSWMAHHQGMALLALANALHGNPMQQYFHAEPQVLATERLLHERVPAGALADPDLVLLPDAAAA